MTGVSVSNAKLQSASPQSGKGPTATRISARGRLAKAELGSPKSGVTGMKADAGSLRGLTKRDQLLDTAWRLFYRDGYHATGIDRILAEADVAKMTLYKHFRSKEELILAVLEKRSDLFQESFSRFLQPKKRTPERRLAAVFDWLIGWVSSKEFRGCSFQKAMAEYQDLQDPIHQAAVAHKAAFYGEIRRLVAEAGFGNRKSLPDQLALLVEGAIVRAHATGSPAPAVQAKEAAYALIRSARGSKTGK